jgi:hypothetical protein
MSLVAGALVEASHLFNATAQALVSSSSNLALNMFTSILPLLLALISLSDSAYLDSRQQASASVVPDYFQTTPQIFAGD